MTAAPECELYTAITEDGSLSLVSGHYLQLYHNRIGAYTEALLNYSNVAQAVLRMVYDNRLPDTLNVLDCCFGLGYNSFVLAQELPHGVNLNVTGIELDAQVMKFVPQVLNQACFFPLRASGLTRAQAAGIGTFSRTEVPCPSKDSVLTFDMIQSCLRDYWRDSKHEKDLHLILHDPFSPKKMPELWTIDLFECYKKALRDGGMVLTYSSAPCVRGAFLDLGFRVYRTPVLDGKWGGTLAVMGDHLEEAIARGELSEHIAPLGDVEYVRLVRSSRVPLRDPGLTGDREQIWSVRAAEQVVFTAENQASGKVLPKRRRR